MYFSARHINIKQKQDCSNFINCDDYSSLVLCDGIGEFNDSGKVADKVAEVIIEKGYLDLNHLFHDKDIIGLKNQIDQGGTTIIFAFTKNVKHVKIEYVGNGGCIYLHGDFYNNQNQMLPYKYTQLIQPDINIDGALTRHLSQNSTPKELIKNEITLSLNHPSGDILLFYTDGINSLEENVIIQDNNGRHWRHESTSIQFILNELHHFLISNCYDENFQELLEDFNYKVLDKLNQENHLEDDASLGIVITNHVLNHYQNVKNT